MQRDAVAGQQYMYSICQCSISPRGATEGCAAGQASAGAAASKAPRPRCAVDLLTEFEVCAERVGAAVRMAAAHRVQAAHRVTRCVVVHGVWRRCCSGRLFLHLVFDRHVYTCVSEVSV